MIAFRWLGIDPGLNGGIAVLDWSGLSPGLVDAIDIPIIGEGAKKRVNVLAVLDFLDKLKPNHGFIERAQAMPEQGASSGFIYGRAVGALETCICASKIPLTIIEASKWKRYFNLPGGGHGKEASRQMALQLFPGASEHLRLKKHHQRAEAMLIALYGYKKQMNALTPFTNVMETSSGNAQS